MIDIHHLRSDYDVRRMGDSDVDSILRLCMGNTLFYQYAEANPTREQILRDLRIAPPNTASSDKYYIGFYQNNTLVAIMDIIDGYPEPKNAFIGFFMMDIDYQGKQIGSSIIQGVAEHLKSTGKSSIQLGIDKDNPQSVHFWKKNGFTVIREVNRNGGVVLVAERKL